MQRIQIFSIVLLLIWIAVGCRPAAAPSSLPNLSAGQVERQEAFPSNIVRPRPVDVWLPDGYDPSLRYPVLYMHDGQMLFDAEQTWNQQEWGVDEVMSRLIEAGTIPPCIVVGIWNNGEARHAEYFPQKPFESLPPAFQDSLREYGQRPGQTVLFTEAIYSDRYLRFLVEELKPWVDAHYATMTDPQHTFVAGSSMGGLISMYAICEYPETFGGAACLSTHWVGIFEVEANPIPQAFMDYLTANLPDPSTHRLYFDYGTETLDALYEPFQLQADSILVQGGYDADNWLTLKFEGAPHAEDAWRSRLHQPITFLMGRASP